MSTFKKKSTERQWKQFGAALGAAINVVEEVPSQVLQLVLSDSESLRVLASGPWVKATTDAFARVVIKHDLESGEQFLIRFVRVTDLVRKNHGVRSGQWYEKDGTASVAISSEGEIASWGRCRTEWDVWHMGEEGLLLESILAYQDLFKWLHIEVFAVADDSLPNSPRWVLYKHRGEKSVSLKGGYSRYIMPPGVADRGWVLFFQKVTG